MNTNIKHLITLKDDKKKGDNIKRKNIKFSLQLIIVLIIIVGCSTESNKLAVDSQVDSAQIVVEKHFQYINEKNKDKLLTTLTEQWSVANTDWGFKNLDSMKIINIEEERNEKVRKGYLIYGRGKVNKTTEKNLKVYKVKYEVKYKKDGIEPLDSGTYDWWYFIIRKDENSPWLIDDFGV